MAASKGYFARANYRFFSSDLNAPPTTDTNLELSESDIWNTPSPPLPELRKPVSSRITTKKLTSPMRISGTGRSGVSAAAAAPVNIPDWSKILKDEYRDNNKRRDSDDDDDNEEDGVDDRVPPHEYVARQAARTRIASFSLHEGVGRTLKGRDLSRVRNAIWEKTGFED